MYRKLGNIVLETIILVGVVCCIALIMQHQQARFYGSLYNHTNLLLAAKIYAVTMKRTIIAVMMYTMGIACILLCLISFDGGAFLRCSQLFVLAAGFIITIWDDEFTFYVSRTDALRWAAMGDILLVAMVTCMYDLLIVFCSLILQRAPLRAANLLAGLLFGGCALICGPQQMLAVLKVYLVWCVAYSVWFLGTMLRQKNAAHHLWATLREWDTILFGIMTAYMILLVFLVSFYKYRTLTPAYSFYASKVPFLTLGMVFLVFFVFIQYHRMGILFGGEANVKLREIESYRRNVTYSLLSRFFSPVSSLIYHADCLAQTPGVQQDAEAQQLCGEMRRSLAGLRQHLAQMDTYQTALTESEKAGRIKINARSLLMILRATLEADGVHSADAMRWELPQSGDAYILADPYRMLQAWQAILESLLDLREHGAPVAVRLTQDAAGIQIAAWTQAAKKNAALARRMKRIFSAGESRPRLVYDEELTLYNARTFLREDRAQVDVTFQSRGDRALRLCCRFEPWNAADDPWENVREEVSPESDARPKIVLLSTSAEQIDLLRAYLSHEPYQLAAFHTQEDMLAYIQKNSGLALVILGNVYFGYETSGICGAVRSRFSVDQLPILLLCPATYRVRSLELLKNVNDILREPFDQGTLVQKIYLLTRLQEAAQETRKAKVDFLQSQMDPHFIFNALSSIMPLCIQDPPQAYRVLNDFSDYLRGRLYPQNLGHLIHIYEEMDVVEAFLAIEKVRFPGRIEDQVCGHYDENALMLPLLLEPIVENCIRHGMKENAVLHVYIRIEDADGFLHFVVRDDGRGMDAAQLSRLRDNEYASNGSVGLENVKKRLSLYYNESIEIDSVPDGGTTIAYKIPKETGGISHAADPGHDRG